MAKKEAPSVEIISLQTLSLTVPVVEIMSLPTLNPTALAVEIMSLSATQTKKHHMLYAGIQRDVEIMLQQTL
jgi:hypothetical protein